MTAAGLAVRLVVLRACEAAAPLVAHLMGTASTVASSSVPAGGLGVHLARDGSHSAGAVWPQGACAILSGEFDEFIYECTRRLAPPS